MKKSNLSINCCPECMGQRKLWNFSNHEEPDFLYCEMCRGENTVNN